MGWEIKESDWKQFRRLHAKAVDTYCKRVLDDVRRLVSRSDDDYDDRYLKLFTLVREHDKEIARLFDDPRRSKALIQIADIRAAGLISDEELAEFSEETRQALELLSL